jgi:type IV pilus assembly protein PilY1
MPWGRSLYPSRTDCPAAGSCTLAQERINFANWFTYHRARILFTKGAISEAFAPLGNNLRLGWGATEFARTSNTVDNLAISGGPTQGVREFSAAHKTAFLSWLQGKTVSGSTPLRFALQGVGEYFKRTDVGSPWRSTPDGSATSNPILGCRRSGHILTTDGYYTDDTFTTSDYAVGEIDNANVGNTYVASAPYRDSNNSNSMADIAMKYWATPLVASSAFSTSSDTVTATSTDPATWLHLNQYMVGLGVNGSVDQDTVSTTMTTATSWPTIPTTTNNTSITKIDDMIHASVNARGRFFSASDGETLKAAISHAVQSGTPTPRSEAGVANTATSYVAGDVVYVPQYNPGGWFGDVKAYAVASTGARTLSWSASEHRPAASLRNIVTSKASGNGGTNFNQSALSTAGLIGRIEAAYQTDNFINYIRGDDSQVGTASGQFRVRSGPLPDFINSTPWLLRGLVDMGYDLSGLPSGNTSYRAYVNSKAIRSPVLALGGNGGMLHFFDGSSTATGGAELFAFIP